MEKRTDYKIKPNLIRYLMDAHYALMEAAAVMAGQYGEDFEHVAQLRGAAGMIKDDWIAAMKKED